MKQLVRFRSLDDSAHASIGQQIGELAAHHPKWHLHLFSTEPVSSRPGVESDTLRNGDAYRMKLRLVLPTTTRAAGEEAEHVAHFSAFASIPAYPRKRARCIALCCWYCTTKQCAADATKDDGLRLNLAAPLYWFAPRTKLTRRAADFLIPATGRSAQARRRATRERRTTRRGSERA